MIVDATRAGGADADAEPADRTAATDPPAISTQLAALRKDYALKTLEESQVDRDPLKQFGVWMVEAIHAQVPEPTAMTLATVDSRGRPSAPYASFGGQTNRRLPPTRMVETPSVHPGMT